MNLLWVPAEAKKKKKKRIPKNFHVRSVQVTTKNVFDASIPGENIWLFRMANKLHARTKTSVISRELLVHPGDWVTMEKVEEAERDLRSLPFIKDATITPKFDPSGQADLAVKTQDTWTTQPQFDISSEGEQTTFSAGFEELNLLGYGKDISYFYNKGVDGVGHLVGYKDPQFLNTRAHLSSEFQDTPTGNSQSLNFSRPFYSLAARLAAGLPFNHSQSLQKVYENGQLISRYDQEHLDVSPFVGARVNQDLLDPLRLQLNYRYSEDVYRAKDVTLPGTLPNNKALSGPVVSASFVESDFIKETFADKAGRVEDTNLGHQANVGVGYVGRSIGATENSIPFSANESFGLGGDGPWFSLFSFGMSSRYYLYNNSSNPGQLINTIYFGNFNYYRHLTNLFPLTGVVHLESAYLQNPDTTNVLSLGGDTGLRGYKVNAYTGNKSLLMNMETRFFSSKEFLHLAYMGGAFFVDAGQVQPEGNAFNRKDIHADLGFGMRFGLTRSADGTVFRVDMAYAVGPVQQDNRWILSISSTQGFRREANTYKNFGAATSTQ